MSAKVIPFNGRGQGAAAPLGQQRGTLDVAGMLEDVRAEIGTSSRLLFDMADGAGQADAMKAVSLVLAKQEASLLFILEFMKYERNNA